MPNENEVVVDAENETEVTEETVDDAESAEMVEVVAQKPQESLEAKRARLMRQLEQTNKKLGMEPEARYEAHEAKPNTSKGLDYGEKAFLVANGIKATDPKEMKLVEDAVKKTGDTLEGVLQNPYFQAQLSSLRELAKTQDATPRGRSGNNIPTDSVEYWLAKPIEEVPRDMRIKVVNAKLNKDKNTGVFYNS